MKQYVIAIVYTDQLNIFAGFHLSEEAAIEYIREEYKDLKGYSLQFVMVKDDEPMNAVSQ